MPQSRSRTDDLRITNAGEVYTIRYYPAALSMMLSHLQLKCYRILRDFIGAIGCLLHRFCTVLTRLKIRKKEIK
jgi:hypothetical protein